MCASSSAAAAGSSLRELHLGRWGEATESKAQSGHPETKRRAETTPMTVKYSPNQPMRVKSLECRPTSASWSQLYRTRLAKIARNRTPARCLRRPPCGTISHNKDEQGHLPAIPRIRLESDKRNNKSNSQTSYDSRLRARAKCDRCHNANNAFAQHVYTSRLADL